MVIVRYNGFLGNNLFQYALGRIIAEELRLRLVADPINGFPNTKKTIMGDELHTKAVTLTGNDIDLSRIIKNPGMYTLNGYFQKFKYYQPYKSKIKHWFKLEDVLFTKLPRMQDGDVVLVVRLGDYLWHDSILPQSYYLQILKQLNPLRVFVCTDSPQSNYFSAFEKYQPVILLSSALEQFAFITTAKTVVMSQSTFSWWAAFLSDSNQVFYPRPSVGLWAGNRGNDLFVSDESRYKAITCVEKYNPTILEYLLIAYHKSKRGVNVFLHKVSKYLSR